MQKNKNKKNMPYSFNEQSKGANILLKLDREDYDMMNTPTYMFNSNPRRKGKQFQCTEQGSKHPTPIG